MTTRLVSRDLSRRSFLKGSTATVAGMAAWAAYLRQVSPTAAQASGEVRLTGGAASPEEEELLRQALDAFAQEFPDITVNYEPITAQYEVKLQTDIAAGRLELRFGALAPQPVKVRRAPESDGVGLRIVAQPPAVQNDQHHGARNFG